MQFGPEGRGCRAGQRCAGSGSGTQLSRVGEALLLADALQIKWSGLALGSSLACDRISFMPS